MTAAAPAAPPEGISPDECAGSGGAKEDEAMASLAAALKGPLGVVPPRIGRCLLLRTLREHDGDVVTAAAAVRASLTWRRSEEYSGGCKICAEVKAGAHPFRQVAFDRHGRATVYCCFAQAFRDSSGFSGDAAHGNYWSPENLLPHLAHTLDNAALSVQLLPFLQKRQERLRREYEFMIASVRVEHHGLFLDARGPCGCGRRECEIALRESKANSPDQVTQYWVRMEQFRERACIEGKRRLIDKTLRNIQLGPELRHFELRVLHGRQWLAEYLAFTHKVRSQIPR